MRGCVARILLLAALALTAAPQASAAQTRHRPLLSPPPVPRAAPLARTPPVPRLPPLQARTGEAAGDESSGPAALKRDRAQVIKELERIAADRQRLAARAAELEREARARGDEERALAARRAALALKLRALDSQRQALVQSLAEVRARIEEAQAAHARTARAATRLLTSLMRLSQLPPSALLLADIEPDQLVIAMAAGDARVSEGRRVLARLKSERARLAALAEERAALLARLEENAAALAREDQALAAAVAAARDRRSELTAAAKQARAQAERLARRADGLADLLRRIEEASRARAGGRTPLALDPPPGTPAFAAAHGHLVLPVEGRLERRFGEALAGGHSRGIVIAGKPQGFVLAPWDGRVVYAAPFLDLGVVAVIAHQDGFFSLLSGLGELLVSEGQWVLAGEPVGRLPAQGTGPRLYFELREGRRPIDPLPWLGVRPAGRG